jgi:hypothetical protein
MTTPKLSAYVSAFNLLANGLPYEDPLRAMLAMFDEVVVAVNTSTDDTAATLRAFEGGALKVVETSFAYTDVTFDGATKDVALQACTQEPDRVYVQMDMDEMVPLSQRDLWRRYAAELLAMPGVDCWMIPTVDLWGSMDTIRADRPLGVKFRMHKGGLRRGVWKQAWIGRTRFDTSRSDSCELIDSRGELARTMHAVPPPFLQPALVSMLNGQYPYTLHLGYVSLEQRVRINRAIWADHWTLRNGGADAGVATRLDQLTDVPLVPHRLALS